MKLGQYTVEISSDHISVPEYQTHKSSDGVMGSCWIPAEIRQKFSVKCQFDGPRECIRIKLFADGVEVDRPRISDKQSQCEIRGHRTSRTDVSDFQFAAPTRTAQGFNADERNMSSPSLWLEFGTITVELYRIDPIYGQRDESDEKFAKEEDYGGRHGEVLHSVQRGEPSIRIQNRNPQNIVSFDYTGGDRHPFRVFYFKHRSTAWLRTNIIASDGACGSTGDLDPNGGADLLSRLQNISLSGNEDP